MAVANGLMTKKRNENRSRDKVYKRLPAFHF